MSDKRPMSDAKLYIIVVALIVGVWQLDKLVGDEPPVDNEPYTGLCTGPTTQGGC